MIIPYSRRILMMKEALWCSVKKVFLKVSKKLQVNTCPGVFFLREQLHQKRDFSQRFFCEFCKRFRNIFYGTLLVAAFMMTRVLQEFKDTKIVNCFDLLFPTSEMTLSSTSSLCIYFETGVTCPPI